MGLVKKLNICLKVLLVPYLKPVSFLAETRCGCSRHGALNRSGSCQMLARFLHGALQPSHSRGHLARAGAEAFGSISRGTVPHRVFCRTAGYWGWCSRVGGRS